MARVVGLRAVAHLRDNPAELLAEYERRAADDEFMPADEARALLDEYAAGKWALVRLECSAEVEDGDGVVGRCVLPDVDGLWFRTDDARANGAHVTEMIHEYVTQIAAALDESGVTASEEQLLVLPIVIEVARDLRESADVG